MPIVEREIPVDDEVRPFEELAVGLPKRNLTIVGLAKRIAAGNRRAPIPTNQVARAQWARSARAKLEKLVRYRPVTIKHAWPTSSTLNNGIETLSYRFEFNNGLSATGVWLRATTSPEDAPISVVLDDDGISSAHTRVRLHLERGEQVLAVNLIFTGDASPDTPKSRWTVPALYTQVYTSAADLPGVERWLRSRPPSALYGLLLAATGEQPLGMQAAQLLGVTHWLRTTKGSQRLFLESTGIRSQVTALVTSALEPNCFSKVVTNNGMESFGYLLDKPVRYQEAPDLFCLDLYKEFDIDSLLVVAEPTKVAKI